MQCRRQEMQVGEPGPPWATFPPRLSMGPGGTRVGKADNWIEETDTLECGDLSPLSLGCRKGSGSKFQVNSRAAF
jgi:hypothetical protein